MKLLFIDTETTGLDPDRNGVVQVAMLHENDELNLTVNPIPLGVEIDKEALKINGLKKKQIEKFAVSNVAFATMLRFMNQYVDKYNTGDKFIAVGYNVKFDVEFLHGWAKREGFNYMGSYIDWRVIDVLVLARTAHYLGQMPEEPENFKLATICKIYGIEDPGHDAMADIKATRELFFKLIERWK